MPEVFISYSSKDRVYVDSILLEGKNYKKINLWASHKKVSTGDDFKLKIEKKIEEADAGIVLVSKNSLQSDFINEVELPALLNKEQNLKEFKTYLIFIDDCNLNDNKLLRTKHFFNSPSTNLNSLSSNKLNNFYKDLFLDITKNVKFLNKSKLIKFLSIPILITSLFIFNQLNFDLAQDDFENEQPTNTIADISTGENNSEIETSQVLNNTICYGPEIEELWLENYLDAPSSINLKMFEVDCNNKMSAQLYYSDELKLTKDDLTEALIYSVQVESTTKCANEFKSYYGYGSTETLFDYQIFFTTDKSNEISYNCIAVFIEPTTQSFSPFTDNLINLDIEEYRTNNGMFLKPILDLNEKECFNKPGWIYGSSSDRFSEDLELSGVYTTYCSSPHNSQVTKTISYIPKSNETFEEIEKKIFDECLIHTDLLFGDLKEIKENLTSEGWPTLSVQVFADEPNLRNGKESKVLCIISNFDYIDIKVETDYFKLVNDKLNQRVVNDKNYIEITNCPKEPVNATLDSDENSNAISFQYHWNASQLNLDSLTFTFKDPIEFLSLTYSPQSEYEELILNSWTSTQFWSPKGSKNGDTLEVNAEMLLKNGELYKDSCVVSLNFED